MPSTIMKPEKVVLFLPLLPGVRAASTDVSNPKGSCTTDTTAGYWGGKPDQVERQQSYLGDPDTMGTFSLPGFNT